MVILVAREEIVLQTRRFPMAVQAIQKTNHRSFLAGIGARLEAFLEFAYQSSRMARMSAEVERLQALSDDQLARRGLSRDGIVRHVFGPYLHL
jgi:hypothetical protein